MRIFNRLSCIGCMFACLLFFVGCSDDETGNGQNGYGYIQLRLFKKQAAVSTFGLSGGVKLDYLKDAEKIEITLIYNDSEVKQTLNITSVGEEGAEFGVRTEKLQLMAGQYILTGYKIYGSRIVNDKAEVLQAGSPDETTSIEIRGGELYIVELPVEVQLRGKVAFRLLKDFTNMDVPQAKAAPAIPQPDSLFAYHEVKFMEITLSAGASQAPIIDTLKTKLLDGEKLLSTDTLSLKAGEYILAGYKLLDGKNTVVLALSPNYKFTVTDNKCRREEVKVVYPANVRAIKDYIALFNIWQKMDGPNWSYLGDAQAEGANWVFKNRPVDEWGIQPGVTLHSNGRVQSVSLGAFNPAGMVPDEIGVLTAIEAIDLGAHSDVGGIETPEAKPLSINLFSLYAKGVNIFAKRMEIGKERLRLKYTKKENSLMAKEYLPDLPYKYATYAVNTGSLANRITGISPEIGKCQSLSACFMANGLIKTLPDEFGTLQNLTDLEIYNCPFEEFPLCLAQLPNVVALNFSYNKKVRPESLTAGVAALCNGKSRNKLQILYLADNEMEEMPDNMRNLSVLGLLNLANNKIKKLKTLTKNVSLIQVFLDYNQIDAIPADFCKIDDIEIFSAVGNRLTEFPVTFNQNKYSLTTINLSENKIRKFAEGFSGVKVETLNLSFNELGKGTSIGGKNGMPVELAKWDSEIIFLQISNNDIDTIAPESFKGLKTLQAFECMGNNLRYMPSEFCTEYLPYLNAIDFSFNGFVKFPALILNVSTLNQLRLPGQADKNGKRTLKDWPVNIEKHFTLRMLDVSGNDIRKVNNFPSLLNYLNISDNANIDITIPSDICSRIMAGTFALLYDDTQYILGCPALGTNK